MRRVAAALALALCATGVAHGTCPSEQAAALRDLFDATGGPRWSNKKGWLVGDPCDDAWHGVMCNSRGGVQALALSMNNLDGQLPASLGSLRDLSAVAMSLNRIRGPLPESFCSLTRLRLVELGYNYLTMDLACFARLRLVESLDLEWNTQLDGRLEDLLALPNLAELNLRNSRLLGNLTAFLTGATKLRVLVRAPAPARPPPLGRARRRVVAVPGMFHARAPAPAVTRRRRRRPARPSSQTLSGNRITGEIPAALPRCEWPRVRRGPL